MSRPWSHDHRKFWNRGTQRFMITGQSPRREWRPNPGGVVRTIDEAVAIAQANGVTIPDDVEFFIDEDGDLDADTTARGPQVKLPSGSVLRWSNLVHDETGKVPFRIRPDILASDEAIVAVMAHEMYELDELRPLLQGSRVTIDRYIELVRPGRPGNFHDRAWDIADAAVDRLRRAKEP